MTNKISENKFRRLIRVIQTITIILHFYIKTSSSLISITEIQENYSKINEERTNEERRQMNFLRSGKSQGFFVLLSGY